MSDPLYLNDYYIEWFEFTASDCGAFRKHGPCTIDIEGRVFFSQTNSISYNRNKGPCVIYPNGEIQYHTGDFLLHRTDGPAVIHEDGRKEYWIDDDLIPPEEYFLKFGVM